MVVDEEFGIDAEGVGAIVIDPSASSSGGESGVVTGGASACDFLLECLVIRNVTFEDFLGSGRDDRDGWAMIGGEISGAIEENEAFEMLKLSRNVFWVAFQ